MKVKQLDHPLLYRGDIVKPPEEPLGVGDYKFTIYVNKALFDYITSVAKIHHRSRNSQIVAMIAEGVYRLAASFEEPEENE